MVNGIVNSSSDDLDVSSDVVLSSVRTMDSESVPVGVGEEGSLEPPPKRPLILSKNHSVGDFGWIRPIPHL